MTDSPELVPRRSLALVAASNPIVIWRVELTPGAGAPPLSGAWLVDPLSDAAHSQLSNLISGAAVVRAEIAAAAVEADAQALVQSVLDAGQSPEVSLAASGDWIREHIEQLKALVKAEREKPGKANLTEPRFPKVAAVEVIEFPHVGEEVAAPVLGLARGVEKLLEEWAAVESVRLRRKYLRGPFGEEARARPLVASAAL